MKIKRIINCIYISREGSDPLLCFIHFCILFSALLDSSLFFLSAPCDQHWTGDQLCNCESTTSMHIQVSQVYSRSWANLIAKHLDLTESSVHWFSWCVLLISVNLQMKRNPLQHKQHIGIKGFLAPASATAQDNKLIHESPHCLGVHVLMSPWLLGVMCIIK